MKHITTRSRGAIEVMQKITKTSIKYILYCILYYIELNSETQIKYEFLFSCMNVLTKMYRQHYLCLL